MPDRDTKQRRAKRPHGHRKTKAVVSLRVNAVYGWLVVGKRTSEIYRLVAEAQRREQRQRDAARSIAAVAKQKAADAKRAGKLPPPDASAPAGPEPTTSAGDSAHSAARRTIPIDTSIETGTSAAASESPEVRMPPLVWGDGNPPSNRMIDHYIAKAKSLMEDEGRELSKSAVAVLGWTWARMNSLYSIALKEKKLTVCVRLLELAVDVFGLRGAIRLQFAPPGSDAPVDDPSNAPESRMTEDQLKAEWLTIARAALARMNPNAGVPLVGEIKQIGPAQPLPPNENGNSRGSNGTH